MRIALATLAALLLSSAAASPRAAPPPVSHAVGTQYDTTHVYVAPEAFDRFVQSLLATFGGATSPRGVFQVTPTSSETLSQLVLTPVGTLSVFGFKTPVPAPFGEERTGYLVDDLDRATADAVRAGAWTKVDPFPDPIGRDSIVQWPGGVQMQFYWHTAAPHYAALTSIPENRIYLTPSAADPFIHAWLRYSKGHVIRDDTSADGAEIGRPGSRFRRIALESGFGRLVVFVTDGAMVWPAGRELTGYEVADLQATLANATAAGVEVLAPPLSANGRRRALLRFPGGYIAEVHTPLH